MSNSNHRQNMPSGYRTNGAPLNVIRLVPPTAPTSMIMPAPLGGGQLGQVVSQIRLVPPSPTPKAK